MKSTKPIIFIIILLLAGSYFLLKKDKIEVAGQNSTTQSEGKDLTKFKKADSCSKTYPWGAPKFSSKEINERSLYFCNSIYSVQFDSKFFIPLWAAEIVHGNTFKNFGIQMLRTEPDISTSKELPSLYAIKSLDYLANGYTPTPMSSPLNGSEKIDFMREAYISTNIAPMNNTLKLGIWGELEKKVIDWAIKRGTVFVVTGPMFIGNNISFMDIDKKRIPIPTHFFKVVVDPSTYESASFIIPNKEIFFQNVHIKNPNDAVSCTNQYNSNKFCSLLDFSVAIKDIEKVTGINFHSSISPLYEDKVEKDKDSWWKK